MTIDMSPKRSEDAQGLVQSTLVEFKNGGFTLKTHQMFSVYTKPVEFENATITAHFGFVFDENSGRGLS